MAGLGSPQGLDRLFRRRQVQSWQREVDRGVVEAAHLGGVWQGPSERRWVERIVRGAGFGLASWSEATRRRPDFPT